MREDITSKITELLKEQRSVKFGKVQRDPINPNELPKSAFPAVYVETTNEDIQDITMYAGASPMRLGVMQVTAIIIVGGKERDTQRNIAVQATEATLMADRTLGGIVQDCRLSRVESVAIGESAPFASCRMVFTVEYCYTVELEGN